jgi:monomeric sarcosine oxidase
MERWDLAVIGCGGIGSAVLWQAARLGLRAVGLDQHRPPHHHGSSHGISRIYRQAYYEHPDYVPLLLEAGDEWRRLERESGRPLFDQVGLLYVGPPDGQIVPSVLASSETYGIPLERLTKAESQRRFASFQVDDDHEVLWEPGAGSLRVESCVEAAIERAIALGATVGLEEPVVAWESQVDGICLKTPKRSLVARRVVVAAGPWSASWWSTEPVRLQLLRQVMHWYESDQRGLRQSEGAPAFFYETPRGFFYGFPACPQGILKLARHGQGQPIATPESIDRSWDSQEAREVEWFLNRHLPAGWNAVRQAACIYTMSEDAHFVIDRSEREERLMIASGFSGHGFKFAAGLGLRLALWAASGDTDPQLRFLGWNRFQSRSLQQGR